VEVELLLVGVGVKDVEVAEAVMLKGKLITVEVGKELVTLSDLERVRCKYDVTNRDVCYVLGGRRGRASKDTPDSTVGSRRSTPGSNVSRGRRRGATDTKKVIAGSGW